MSRLRWLTLALIALAAMLAGAQDAAALPGPTGSLFADSPAAACVTAVASADCASTAPLAGATDLALSADGRHAYVAAASVSAVAVLERDRVGAFSASPAQCMGAAGSSACTPGLALRGVASLVVSPDGKNLYAASPSASAIAVLARDTTTGSLTQPLGACLADEIAGPSGPTVTEVGCLPAQGLAGAGAVAISPDGLHVYVASPAADAVALLVRSPLDGRLSQPAGPEACVSTDTDPGPLVVLRDPGCTAPDAPLADASTVAVSPDGQHVYVAATASRTVVSFARDAATGALTFSSCVSNDVDGGAADLPAEARCTAAHGLDAPSALAVSPDAGHVYVASARDGAVAAFARDPGTGALSQLEPACVSDQGATVRDPECVSGIGLAGAVDLTVTVDGAHVYVAARDSSGVAVLKRDAASGRLEQLSSPDGCLSSHFTVSVCRYSARVERARAVAVTPDGRHVLAASPIGAVVSLERQLAPVCVPILVARVSGPTSVPLVCSDANGDALTYSVLDAPNRGRVTAIDHAVGTATYAPTAGAAGVDVFSFTASDDGGATGSPALASLELAPAVLLASVVDTRAPQLRAGKLVVDRNRRIRIKLRCPSHEKLGCVGTISIKTVRRIPARTLRLAKLAAGRRVKPVRVKLVSKLRFSLRGATTRTISTRLRKKHVRLLNRLGKTRVEVALVARDPAGNVSRVKRRVVLQARARR